MGRGGILIKRIILFGATGRVGVHILKRALADGYEVTALVRTPGKLDELTRQYKHLLRVVSGDVRDEERIRDTVEEGMIIISALGTDGTTTLTDSTRLLIDMMYRTSIQRIIAVGTAGILQSRTEPDKYRYESSESRRRSSAAANEHRRMYEMLEQTTLDWTIVCPTYLPEGPFTGVYRTEKDTLPEGGTEISTADTADFTYRQIKDRTYIRSRAGIAY